MSYYWYNRQELLQKAKDKHCNCGRQERATEYYTQKKDVIIKKQIISIRI